MNKVLATIVSGLAVLTCNPAQAFDYKTSPTVNPSYWAANLQFVMAVGKVYGAKTTAFIVKNPTEGSSPLFQIYKNGTCEFYIATTNNTRIISAIFEGSKQSDVEKNVLALEAHELGHCLTRNSNPIMNLKEQTLSDKILDERAQDIFALVFMQQYHPENFDSAVDLFYNLRNKSELSIADDVHRSYDYRKDVNNIKELAKNYTPLEISRYIVYNEPLPKI